MARAIEKGVPKLRIEEAAAKTQARIDSGQQIVTGVNAHRPTEDRPVEVLKVDNANVRKMQLDKLARLRGERDQSAVEATLDALAKSAETGEGNLLALAVEAGRAKATVGEISAALERVWGRHQAEIKSISGVYKREVGAMSPAIDACANGFQGLRRRMTGAARRIPSSPRMGQGTGP